MTYTYIKSTDSSTGQITYWKINVLRKGKRIKHELSQEQYYTSLYGSKYDITKIFKYY